MLLGSISKCLAGVTIFHRPRRVPTFICERFFGICNWLFFW